ncbi:coA-transferase family III domain-containing protein [Ditylenchus destructor]|nr:coA-transferase family III domain-containing protein [Ditylenchus destructor]
MGAEVWKIERPGTGDDVRSWIPPSVNNQSSYFITLNRNKKSVAVNLAHRDGQELMRKLSIKADVLLENFKTGQMTKYGLDYQTLTEFNPRLIYCSLTGYGSTGPYAHDPGYDVIAEAVGGFMSITGSKETQEPCKAGVAVTDMLTGLYAHGAILAALLDREKSGFGQLIQCNLLATQIVALLNIGSNYLNAGMEGRAWGTEHESIVPYQAFKTKDGRYYVIGATTPEAFKELCTLLGVPHIADMPKFQTNKDRVINREELLKIISERFLLEDLAHWKKVLRSRKFPSGPVNSIKDAYDHEQVQHLGLMQNISHPTYGTIKITGPAVQFSRSENKVRSAPPTLGEHTIEVLSKELDLSSEKLEKLKAEHVISY